MKESEFSASAPAAAQPPRRVRRVGTLTLGLVLVGLGGLMLTRVFVPDFDWMAVLRFAPALLVVLGVEVLVYAARPDVTLKYDWLSMFVCFLVLCGAAGVGAVSYLGDRYLPGRDAAQNRLAADLETQSYAALAADKALVRDMSVEVRLSDTGEKRPLESLTPAELADADEADAYLTLQNQYPSAEAFAADCRTLLAGLRAAGLPFTRYTFDTWQEGAEQNGSSYTLTLNGPWQADADTARLAAAVTGSYWLDGASYATAAERDDAARRASAETAVPADET